jgi:hypothetical protein
MYRIDSPCSGTPVVVQIGSAQSDASDIAFVQDRLLGISGTGVLKEFATDTFDDTGTPVDLTTLGGIGGMAYDGDYFYIASGDVDAVLRYSDSTGTALLDPPDLVYFSTSDLEMFEGQLWGYIANLDKNLLIGRWDRDTGQFTEEFQVAQVADSEWTGMAILRCGCDADFNGDGAVDSRDVISFLNAWTRADPAADFDGNGVVDTRDVVAFLNAWVASC